MSHKRSRDASLGPSSNNVHPQTQIDAVNNAALDVCADRDHDAPAVKRPRRKPTKAASTKEAELTPSPAPVPKEKKAATKNHRAKKSAQLATSTSSPHPTLPVVGLSQLSTFAQGFASAPVPSNNKGKRTTAASSPSGERSHGPEKRAAKFIASLPDRIAERAAGLRSQMIFMVARNRAPGTLCEEFSVLGSTGNIYTVTIDRKPRCDCPDTRFGDYCKHILFVFLKVLQVSEKSNLWYQKALLQTELQEIFDNSPLPNSTACPYIREAYALATGKAPANATAHPEITAEAPAETAKKGHRPGPEDDCVICFHAMHGAADASLVFCGKCRIVLHKECFALWQKSSAANGATLTCVWCRANWVVCGAARAVGAGMGSHVTGISRGY